EKQLAKKGNLKLPNELLEPAILRHSLDNVSFFLKIKPYLVTSLKTKKSYFTDTKYQTIFNIICTWYDKRFKFPNEKEMILILDKFEKDADVKVLTKSLIREVYEGEENEIDISYVEEETKRFIQENKIYEAMLESQIDIESGNFDAIAEKMRAAITVNFDKDLGVSIRDIAAGLTEINSLDDEDVIPSDFPSMDSEMCLDGGFRNDEVYIFAAIPGLGKCLFRDVKVMISYEIDTETGEII
ncbi:MAG: hypothetical protein PF693_21600, partial [Spirochaetia bacterium]|nr:hypothetical protein [Spirochaetia bacterium]